MLDLYGLKFDDESIHMVVGIEHIQLSGVGTVTVPGHVAAAGKPLQWKGRILFVASPYQLKITQPSGEADVLTIDEYHA